MAASKKISVDQLASEIHKILDEYGEDVGIGVTRQAVEVAAKGAEAINSSASGKFGGKKYRRSWYTKTQQLSRVHADVVICSRQYRVAHLLEKSHPVGNRGGSFSGRPHIKPVEEIIIKEYENECKRIITKG